MDAVEAVDVVLILTRVLAALIWTHLAIVFIRDESPAIPMVRMLVMSTVLLGLWFLVIGGLVSLFVGDLTVVRWLYTIYTAFASIVGLAILSGPWRRPPEE
jgi:hypothetical protein